MSQFFAGKTGFLFKIIWPYGVCIKNCTSRTYFDLKRSNIKRLVLHKIVKKTSSKPFNRKINQYILNIHQKFKNMYKLIVHFQISSAKKGIDQK